MEDFRHNENLVYSISKVGFVNVTRNKNFIFEYKNGKDLYSFVYVEDGEIEYYFYKTRERLELKKGNCLFIPKQFPYKTKIKIIIFDFLENNIPFQITMPFFKSIPKITGTFSSFSVQNSNNNFLILSKIYELFYYFQKETFSLPKKYKKILLAINEIEKNYFENQKISQYADMCGMSESNFRKLFKEYKGKSPIEYRNMIRCKEVEKMLDSGEFTVSEAAYLAGFNNMSFFYQVYNNYAKIQNDKNQNNK